MHTVAPRRCTSRAAKSTGDCCALLSLRNAAPTCASFDVGGSASYLSVKQEDDLKAWVSAALPRSTRQIGAVAFKNGVDPRQIRSKLLGGRPFTPTVSGRN